MRQGEGGQEGVFSKGAVSALEEEDQYGGLGGLGQDCGDLRFETLWEVTLLARMREEIAEAKAERGGCGEEFV